jgi:DNA polymerase
MLVGEGPGQQENLQGRPFVGAAGQLLDRILAAISLRREDVYIANIVKCRPPANRVPSDDEALVCLPFLLSQIDLVRPEIVICLGATALRHLVGKDFRITRFRGKWFERDGIRYLPTFHPAALLRDPSKKREAWEDFQLVRDALNHATSGETPVQLRLSGEE